MKQKRGTRIKFLINETSVTTQNKPVQPGAREAQITKSLARYLKGKTARR
jgi:hypothetical protein